MSAPEAHGHGWDAANLLDTLKALQEADRLEAQYRKEIDTGREPSHEVQEALRRVAEQLKVIRDVLGRAAGNLEDWMRRHQ